MLALIVAPGQYVRPRMPDRQPCTRCTGAARWLLGALAVLGVPLASAAAQTTNSFFVVLVFSKTMGFRHDSIPEGIAAIRALGSEHGFTVDDTEDAGRFTDATLARYKAIVFINDRRRPRSGSEGRV